MVGPIDRISNLAKSANRVAASARYRILVIDGHSHDKRCGENARKRPREI